MNIIIFAGGQGTRLWPASRANKPKQFLKLVGNKTLLEQTYNRIRSGFKPSQVFIATSSQYVSYIKKQLTYVPAANFSLEPARRNRGPALGLAVLIMQSQNKDDVFATAWSDDHISNPKLYLKTLAQAGLFIKNNPNKILAVSAKPTAPSSAFCYIKAGEKIRGRADITSVKKFTNKPNKKVAQKYFQEGGYFWNTGYFISTGSNILNLYQKFYPKSYQILMKIKPFIGTSKQSSVIKKYYPLLESFDFEDILRTQPKELLMMSANFGWADIGRWSVIKDIQSKNKVNLTLGKTVLHKTTGSLVYNYNNKQVVTALSLDNLIIINTDEALLVANKDSTEDLKALIKLLEKDKKLKKYL
ncbi:MAG TPA: sugar phosphate nucleotidyltransferase [Candidatus Doudnabacteria bacterium]|nr:sugar phosphate nucleotidyltransferase [Candidatus Doudnabacteria bacterium]